MTSPRRGPGLDTTRLPRISLPVAVVGFLAAVAGALLLVALILVTDGGGQTATAATPPPDSSGSPSPTAEPSLSPSPSAQPPASPGAMPVPPGTPAPNGGPDLAFPIEGDAQSVLMAPGPDGGVYTAARAGDSVVVGLVEPDGRVAPGWPIELHTRWCTSLRTAADGSLRAACDPWTEGSEDDGGLQAPVMRIFGIDSRGRQMPGWPVDVESGSMIEMVGDDVAVIVRPYQGDAIDIEGSETALFGLIARDGRITMGSDEIELACCQGTVAIGAGQGYAVNRFYGDDADAGRSELVAFDLDGLAWKADIEGIASDPAFDDHGNAHLSVWTGSTAINLLITYDRSGRVVASSDQSMAPSNGWSGAGNEYPAAPIVSRDGSSTFLIDDRDGTSILALDEVGDRRPGWPYESATGIEEQGVCPPQDTGCGTFRVTPQVAGGTLYVALGPSGSDAGGSIIALSPSGSVKAGWPVGLRRSDAHFWRLLARPDGGLWALAAERDGETYDATLLSIAPDSTVVGKVTIVEGATIGP
jgi:hypothetical protein